MTEIHNVEYNSDAIIQEAQANGLGYLSLERLGENRKYFTKSCIVLDDEVYSIISDIHTQIYRVVNWLIDKPQEMCKIVPAKIANVIFKRPGRISPLQRYDVIIDTKGKYGIVEVNSETPAGIPESINSLLFDRYNNVDGIYNANISLEEDLIKAFEISDAKTVDVFFCDDTDTAFHKVGEDYTNALYLSSLYNNKVNSRIVNIKDVEIHPQGISAYGQPITHIHSFYPLERLFMDEGGDQFWKLYIEGRFDILNGPVNLLTQSKAFRAYLFQNMDMLESLGVITNRQTFNLFVPKYYYTKQPNTLSKPTLYREGVGIGEDLKGSVYQELVEQKIYSIDTYEGEKQGYLTIGIYCDSENPIGAYTRFCESKITDYTSYYLPSYNKINEETINLSELCPGPSSRMMFQ